MPITENEQSVERPRTFLALGDETKVVLLSKMYSIESVFMQHLKMSVLFDENALDVYGMYEPSTQYYYWARVDGKEGALRLPSSSFYYMNGTEKATEKSKRDFEWLIRKSGSGLGTKYETIRGKDVKPVSEQQLEEYTAKLTKVCTREETRMREKLDSLVTQAAQEAFAEPH